MTTTHQQSTNQAFEDIASNVQAYVDDTVDVSVESKIDALLKNKLGAALLVAPNPTKTARSTFDGRLKTVENAAAARNYVSENVEYDAADSPISTDTVDIGESIDSRLYLRERGSHLLDMKQGMNAVTGKLLDGIEHLFQSIQDILTTHLSTRVMRREYGSELFDLIDAAGNKATIVRVYYAVAVALRRWEPRYDLTKVIAEGQNMNGQMLFTLTGEYYGQEVEIKRVSIGGDLSA